MGKTTVTAIATQLEGRAPLGPSSWVDGCVVVVSPVDVR